MWHKDTKLSDAVVKTIPVDFLYAGLLQAFNLLKKKKKKGYLLGTIKWSPIKQDMPLNAGI